MAFDLSILWNYGVVVLLIAAYYYLSGWFRSVVFALKLPGPPALPILGNTLMVSDQKGFIEIGKTGYQKYGLLFRAWVTIIPTIVVLAPEHLQVILGSKRNTDKIFYNLLHNFLGQGLITNSGDKWKLHRRAIQPSFNITILESFISTFHDSAQLMVQDLSMRKDLSSVNVTAPVNQCIFNILHEAVLGIRASSQCNNITDSPFRQGKVVVPYRMVHPWLLLDWIYRLTNMARNELQQQNNLKQYTKKIIRERRKMKLTNNFALDCAETPKKKPFVDFMIEVSDANDTFTEEDIVHELCTLMLAGQDSVGAALAFALYEFARHPDVQELAFQEIDAIFADDQRVPSMNDLRQLKYLEQCVKETLRLYPSVPFVMKILSEDAKLGKHTIPSGTSVLIAPFSTHRLPHIYPDPEKFDPNRFRPDQMEKRHPYAHIPFSAGPRNCIGHKFAMMELKTVLSTILKNYRLSIVPGHENINMSYRITMRASGGIWICFSPRVQS